MTTSTTSTFTSEIKRIQKEFLNFKKLKLTLIFFGISVLFLSILNVGINPIDNMILFIILSMTLGIKFFIIDVNTSEGFYETNKNKSFYSIIFIICLIPFILWFFSTPMFHAKSYHDTLKTGSELNEQVLKTTEPTVVPYGAALRVAKQVIAKDYKGGNISSQYKLGQGEVLIIKGQQEWVFPLRYQSFFAWYSRDTIPGYVTVNATNKNAIAKLIISPFKYSPSAWFFQNINRKSWFDSSMRSVYTHFEVDDNNDPYFISSIIQSDIVWNKKIIKKVIIYNAKTGDKKVYAISNIPKWVDFVFPKDMLYKQVNWNGKYANGFINSMTTKNNVEQSTVNSLLEVAANNKLYYYTGMTSPSNTDESLISAKLIDPRTDTQYIINKVSGFMDTDSAIEAIDAKLLVTKSQSRATQPVLKLIDGQFYYFATITSKSNIYLKSAAIKANNVSEVYFGKGIKVLMAKIKLSETDPSSNSTSKSDEKITVSKEILSKIMKKITELEALKKQLQ